MKKRTNEDATDAIQDLLCLEAKQEDILLKASSAILVGMVAASLIYIIQYGLTSPFSNTLLNGTLAGEVVLLHMFIGCVIGFALITFSAVVRPLNSFLLNVADLFFPIALIIVCLGLLTFVVPIVFG